jgi:hypothetical protein
MKFLHVLALSLLLVVAWPATARAHDEAFTLKYVDGNNIIVASYNVHDFTPDLPITFNLRIFTISGVPVAYKSVETVVKKGDEVVFDETMAASNYNDVNWIYAFGKAGDYDLTLQFTDHDAPVAHANFPIQVEGHVPTDPRGSRIVSWPTAAALLAGVALTLGAQALFKPDRRRKPPGTSTTSKVAAGTPG